MANFKDTTITTLGENLVTYCIANSIAIQFTQCKTSSNQYPDSTDFKALTDLTSIEQTTTVGEVVMIDDNTFKIISTFINAGVATAYSIWAFGIYAHDPQTNADILFSITPSESPADTMPPETGSGATFIAQPQYSISGDLQISTTLDPAGLVTHGDLANYLPLSGGTMTGQIVQPLDPTADTDLVNKKYVDNATPTGNFVTLDTNQTITGKKNFAGSPTTFYDTLVVEGNITPVANINVGINSTGRAQLSMGKNSKQQGSSILAMGAGSRMFVSEEQDISLNELAVGAQVTNNNLSIQRTYMSVPTTANNPAGFTRNMLFRHVNDEKSYDKTARIDYDKIDNNATVDLIHSGNIEEYVSQNAEIAFIYQCTGTADDVGLSEFISQRISATQERSNHVYIKVVGNGQFSWTAPYTITYSDGIERPLYIRVSLPDNEWLNGRVILDFTEGSMNHTGRWDEDSQEWVNAPVANNSVIIGSTSNDFGQGVELELVNFTFNNNTTVTDSLTIIAGSNNLTLTGCNLYGARDCVKLFGNISYLYLTDCTLTSVVTTAVLSNDAPDASCLEFTEVVSNLSCYIRDSKLASNISVNAPYSSGSCISKNNSTTVFCYIQDSTLSGGKYALYGGNANPSLTLYAYNVKCSASFPLEYFSAALMLVSVPYARGLSISGPSNNGVGLLCGIAGTPQLNNEEYGVTSTIGILIGCQINTISTCIAGTVGGSTVENTALINCNLSINGTQAIERPRYTLVTYNAGQNRKVWVRGCYFNSGLGSNPENFPSGALLSVNSNVSFEDCYFTSDFLPIAVGGFSTDDGSPLKFTNCVMNQSFPNSYSGTNPIFMFGPRSSINAPSGISLRDCAVNGPTLQNSSQPNFTGPVGIFYRCAKVEVIRSVLSTTACVGDSSVFVTVDGTLQSIKTVMKDSYITLNSNNYATIAPGNSYIYEARNGGDGFEGTFQDCAFFLAESNDLQNARNLIGFYTTQSTNKLYLDFNGCSCEILNGSGNASTNTTTAFIKLNAPSGVFNRVRINIKDSSFYSVYSNLTGEDLAIPAHILYIAGNSTAVASYVRLINSEFNMIYSTSSSEGNAPVEFLPVKFSNPMSELYIHGCNFANNSAGSNAQANPLSIIATSPGNTSMSNIITENSFGFATILVDGNPVSSLTASATQYMPQYSNKFGYDHTSSYLWTKNPIVW